MKFKHLRKVFLAVALSQMIFSLFLFYYVEIPAQISSLDVRKFDRSQVVLDKDGGVLNVFLSKSDEWCVPVPLDKMGSWTAKIAIALEDKRFKEHSGIDIIALARAFISNIRSGRVVSGASTITSQLIRISIPRERTLYTKLLEFWSALRLENILKKDEILELYLNRAPFGGNIRGIEAAGNAYFNKKAESLSLAESVSLISMLSSPSRFRPDRFPEKNKEIRNTKLDYLAKRGIISLENTSLAKQEQLTGRRYPMQNDASMAVMHVKQYLPDESVLRSTIDPNYQILLEKNISEALKEYPERITSAGIIVENATGAVRAYIGNSRHGTSLPDAQVDCGAAPRSPGSALKPFIYASSFESGILTPASLLADTPLAFRGSAPRNFDMSYRGPVTVRNALSGSLNAPAVRVLRMVGYSAGKAVLNRFGFDLIQEDPLYYTDSLILGGCEVTLLQLAAAYRALAAEGSYMELLWNEKFPALSKQVISPEAAYLVTNILQDQKRLIPIYQEIFQDKNMSVAFKTGTSYGFRDAWCLGYTKNYTIGIWVGSPPGAGDSNLVGMQAATPIMLKVAKEIWNETETRVTRPPGIYLRNVCSLSGALPTKNCPRTIKDFAIKNVSRTNLCPLHKEVGGHSFIAWPPEFSNWMQNYENTFAPGNNVKIIRPASGHTVILQNNGGKERIFLSAEGEAPHYWYLDGKFIGISRNGKGIFTDVGRGRHKASVLSGESSDTVSFEVKTPMQIREKINKENLNVLN
ncbi:MAG: penicillin-binding protein 1C [Synergistaceae bacterium]|jgi:penicillin-binding protein 1C|nr:penicillin-binding protein 1C [Synergistaceae bacterium]